jgi:diacylglycerol kinase
MSLRRRIQSFGYAFQGLADLFRSQPNARIHAVATVVVAAAGWLFGISRLEWVAVVGCIALVLALEAVNTALEHLTDLVSPGQHPLAGRAKDVAAAAVLIGAIGAVVVAALVFVPHIIYFLNR